MIQEELLHDILERLERMEHGQQSLREDLTGFKQEMGGFKQEMTSFRQEIIESLRELQRSVRGLKLKASKTWSFLHYIPKFADERIVKTARRVDAIKEHLGIARMN